MIGSFPVLEAVDASHVPGDGLPPGHPVAVVAEHLSVLRGLASALLKVPLVPVTIALGTESAHCRMTLHPGQTVE